MPVLISTIIPLWNSVRYLGETIESVFQQDITQAELIFIDDGSTDNSAQLAQQLAPQARYYFQPHQGISAALNHGIKVAQGEYLAFLDADDLWTLNSLSYRLAAISANNEIDIVAGHVEQFFSPELAPEFIRTIKCPKIPLPGYLMGAMLIRKSAFSRVGGFDQQIPAAQGVEWFVRAIDANLRLQLLSQVVLRRRLHKTNHSHLQIQLQWYPQILKASLDRRRAAHQGIALELPLPNGSTEDSHE